MFRSLMLSESTNASVPDHFKSLIETLLLERSKMKHSDTDNPKCLKIEIELVYCVALTVALELGFRLDKAKLTTTGFDLRAFKELSTLVQFRDETCSYLSSTLFLPFLGDWQVRVISVPLFEVNAVYNLLALYDDQVMFSSSTVINCTKYIATTNKGIDMLKDLKPLSEIFTKEFSHIRDEAYANAGLNSYGFLCLPDEVKRLIFLKLSAKDFVNLCESNKEMWNFITDEKTWKHFLQRDFKVVLNEGSPYLTYQAITEQRGKAGSAEPSHPNTIASELSLEYIDHGPFFPGHYM